MAVFEVHYSFSCSGCKVPNNEWMEVEAAHEVEALASAHRHIHCSQCEAALEPRQRLTTTMKRIG
jgi:hypothetical protein